MPRMSGPQLVAHLRTLQPAMRTILMSGHTPETVLRQGEVGPDAVFLQKPFEIEVMLGHVRRLLASGGLPGKGSSPA